MSIDFQPVEDGIDFQPSTGEIDFQAAPAQTSGPHTRTEVIGRPEAGSYAAPLDFQPFDTTPSLQATDGPGIVQRVIERATSGRAHSVREIFSPLLGSTDQERLRESVPDDQGRPVYRPLGDTIEREGFIPGLSHPMVPLPKAANKPNDNAVVKIGKGTYNTAANFLEFMESPFGLATAGLGAAGPNASRAVAGAFAADMASKTPAAAAAVDEALRNEDLQEITEAGLNLAGSVILPMGLVKHALTKPKASGVQTPAPDMEKPVVSEFGGEQPIDFQPVAEEAAPAVAPASERLDTATPAPAPTVEPAAPRPSVLAKHPVIEVPLKELSLSEDVPNFKADADADTGVVAGQQLEGKYERLGTGAITVYERSNGQKEVISGRHRFDLAKRSGEETIPAQVVREDDGFTPKMATILDAEMNIRDGQGTASDYANYFRNTDMTLDQAQARGLVSRAKGKAGWDIGKNASEDVYALFRAGKINEAQAAAIGKAAPGEVALQRVGSKAALDGKSPQELTNFIQAVRLETRSMPQEQFDLFADDDSALKEAERLASIASKIQTELGREIKATDNAAKSATTAKAKGIAFERPPQEILAENVQLKAARERWDNWALHKDLVDQVRGYAEMDKTLKSKPSLEQRLDKLKINTKGQLHAFGLIPEVWNTLIDLVKVGVRTGRKIGEAVDWALAEIKRGNPSLDEAGARAHLLEQFKDEVPGVAPLRQFGEKIQQDESIAPEVKAAVSEYTYRPRSNETDLQTAHGIISERGLDGAMSVFKDERNNLPGAVRSALGKALIQKLATDYKVASGKGERITADELLEKQVGLIDHELRRSTEIAQSLQAMRMYGDMSPTAIVRHARRLFNQAGQKQMDQMKPGLDAVADALRRGNAEAVEDVRQDPQVNQAAQEAVNEAVEQSAATHKGIVMELAEPFAQSPFILNHAREAVREKVDQLLNKQPRPPGMSTSQHHQILLNQLAERAVSIANGHYQGAEPGITLKDKLQTRLGITEAYAGRLAKQLDAQFAKLVENAKAKLKQRIANERARKELLARPEDQVRQSRSIWSREKQKASEALVKAYRSWSPEAGGPRKTALQEFAGRLTQRLREQLNKSTPAKTTPLTDVQVLREAVQHAEKYDEVWEQTRHDLQEAFADQPHQLAEIHTFFEENAPSLWNHKQLDRILSTQLRDLNVNLGQALRKHASLVDNLNTHLADRVLDEVKLQGPKAVELRRVLKERFNTLAEERKRALLDQIVQAGQKVARPIKRSYDRLIDLSNLGAFTDQKVYDAVREKMDLPVWTTAFAGELTKRASDLQLKPEGFQRDRATIDLLNFLTKEKGIKAWELPMALWYANTLSGLTTPVHILADNLGSIAGNLAVSLLRQPDALPEIVQALGRGAKKGAQDSASVLQTGYVTGVKPGLYGSHTLELNPFGGPLKFLNAYKYVGRLLSATHVATFKPAWELRQTLAAHSLAKGEGLRGDLLTQRVADLLGHTDAKMTFARARAAAEGLTGLDYRRRVNELIEQSREDTMPGSTDQARDYALRSTYLNDTYGALGAVVDAYNSMVQRISDEHPALATVARLVVPFTRVVSNVLNEKLNYTPVGAWRAWRAGKTGQLYGQELTGARLASEQSELYTKAVMGTLAMSGLAALAAQSLHNPNAKFAITGNGPATPDQRKQLMETGWRPNSVKIGDRYIAYNRLPIGYALSIIGNYMDALRYRKLGDQDALNRSVYALKGTADGIIHQSFLESVGQVFEAAGNENTKDGADKFAKWAAKTGSSFVVPNGLRQIDKAFDPTVYEADGIKGLLQQQLPFVRRNGRPSLNVLGEPVLRTVFGYDTAPVANDPLWQLLAEKQAFVPPVRIEDQLIGDKKRGPDFFRAMTPEEFYEFTATSGPAIRARLEQAMDAGTRVGSKFFPALPDLEPDQAKELVQRIAHQERTKAKANFRP